MPVLLSINNYYYRRGGAEVVFLAQNQLFEDIGWQVVPFAMQHPKNLNSPWESYFVEEIEFGTNYSLLQKMTLAARITYSFEARKKIAALALQVKPDVAHAHNVYHHISPAIFGRLKSLGIVTVLTLHDLKIACPAYKMITHDGVCERCKHGALWNVVAHRCIKGSLIMSTVVMVKDALHKLLGSYARDVDHFVVPSRFYLEKLVAWGWPRERFSYIPNYVEVKALTPNHEIGKAFVYFGRLEPEKGLVTFIKAVARAGVKAWIIGVGSEEAKLRELVIASAADIEFRGYRSGESLFDVVRAARAMVLPSEWYENAPMSLMETYALERPVIGANIGGIPELIKVGETGALFTSGDVASLTEQLRLFDAMPDETVLAMGRAGRAWMEQDFNAMRYRERLMALYRRLGVMI